MISPAVCLVNALLNQFTYFFLHMQNTSTRHSYYSFFTKYSLLDDYGFFSGLKSRIFKKILPSIPDEGSFELFLLKNRKSVDSILDSIDFANIEDSYISLELDTSLKALCSKITAFGLDVNIYSKFRLLGLDSEPFKNLLSEMPELESQDAEKTRELSALLERIETNVHSLRKFRRKIGVNLHTTMATRRILEYIERVKELIELKLNLNSPEYWEKLIKDHIIYIRKKDSIRRFIIRHQDLLILEIVEHTSTRGQKYIAENNKEYRGFLYKSMLGGALISIFALFKVMFDSNQIGPLGDAIIFSLNYAICFILITQIGGIIATKQPAMTASTIAKHIDKDDDLEIDSMQVVVVIVRKVFGSQFISLAGNFIMALIFASLTFTLLRIAGFESYLDIDADILMSEVLPGLQLIAYSATAGFFLALSGIISGYVDNKIIASKIPHRIANNRIFLYSEKLANFIRDRGGAIIGNLTLGFFLGSAFLLSYLFAMPVDIRHIAFSSSYLGYAIMSQPFDAITIIKAFSGILIIGFTNLIVSFFITLSLTLKSRGANFSIIPRLLILSLKDFVAHPFDYFIVRDRNTLKKDLD